MEEMATVMLATWDNMADHSAWLGPDARACSERGASTMQVEERADCLAMSCLREGGSSVPLLLALQKSSGIQRALAAWGKPIGPLGASCAASSWTPSRPGGGGEERCGPGPGGGGGD